MKRTIYAEEHEALRVSFRRFLDDCVVPHHLRWEEERQWGKSLFAEAGAAGFLGLDVPQEHGGGGVEDYRFNAVMVEEICAAGVLSSAMALMLHNDVVLPYILRLANDDQRHRWLPGMTSGALLGAIAMTEPGTGSDLSAIRTRAERDGDHFVLNGAKTFISNGWTSDLIVTVARTSDEPHEGLSLIVVESGVEGFSRDRKLDKLGLLAQDTAELSFRDCRVPQANLLGVLGGGFPALMDGLGQERLSIAVSGMAMAQAAFDETLGYVSSREAFGRPIGSFQNSRFALAEMKTELDVGWAFLDQCIEKHVSGTLSPVKAAEAKWWSTELQKRVVDRCVQLHGGYGFMLEYPITRMYRDTRGQTIYGGTTEIMKEIIGRSLGV